MRVVRELGCRGTHEEHWQEFLAGCRNAVACGGHGLVIQNQRKRRHDVRVRQGHPGSWKPSHEVTKSSRSAEEWRETRHRQNPRSNRRCRWGSFLAGGISAGA